VPPPLDCLIIGGGPAGLTAALYFARFRRRFMLIDAGEPRARWIPSSHNLPFFADGISGPDILRLQLEHARRYNAEIVQGSVTTLRKNGGSFAAVYRGADGRSTELSASRVLLATGAIDIEPDLPNLPNAIQRGLVRYCPICDGFESKERKIAVLGHGSSGLAEASFIARTYSHDVTLLTLGQKMHLSSDEAAKAQRDRIKIVETPVSALLAQDGRMTALTTDAGNDLRFDVLYSALGLKYRNQLALGLGAAQDSSGALLVDDHNQTSVKGLYAAGAIVRGLDQIVVAMGHAAVAATAIHNVCELPTEDEA